ncbi:MULTISPECIES: hypothetical protein [Cellvibrio]|jgi:hypothetical protein|uniref:Uncharacterized protein n=1 Tax=Cellvibrio fibrivorans TaxID=126350 RepID=A0ABU1UTC1_9GAMM|nr:hypothetical protein [Cellvibrio fibrivorans]MDR7088387.1 hypothetical protein [Cellvibrio fibrivorans]
MKKIISSNELFKIFLVENYDADNQKVTSHYELFEGGHRPVETFESLDQAQQTMLQKTEFWKQLTKKIPLYFEARFIA